MRISPEGGPEKRKLVGPLQNPVNKKYQANKGPTQ